MKKFNRHCILIFIWAMCSIHMVRGMEDLAAKFDRELRPGTTVVSYAFSFPGREPRAMKTVPWLQGKREIRVYKW